MNQDHKETPVKVVTAAVLVIGNEILSGRTKDKNLVFLAENLSNLGVQLREARIIPDIEEEIVDAINACRAKYDYVFTTGGIGPTHDDITADSVGKAFNLAVEEHPEAVKLFEKRLKAMKIAPNKSSMRMARTPLGATLIENPVSGAPGFRVENVYVMAGIPVVMQAMFASLKHELVGGDPILTNSVRAYLGESVMADSLSRIQDQFADVEIGSYPFHFGGRYGAVLVCRSTKAEQLAAAGVAVRAMIADLGGSAGEVEN